MNNNIALTASAALLSGLFMISGCSSDDGGGGGTAAVPANATVIDDTNAEQIIGAMASSLSSLDQALAVEATPAMGLDAAIDHIKPLIKNRLKNSGIDLATGASFNEVEECLYGGTITASGDETDDYPNYSETVTATFTNCSMFDGMVINGTVSGTFTENQDTSAYTDSVTGSLSITITAEPDTIKTSFNGLNFQESGNYYEGTFTTTKSTFALSIEVNGTTQFAFLSELKANIVESNGTSCPESGHILVTGGNGTTAEGIYNGDGMTMTIKANGDTVNDSYDCRYL